MSSFDIFSDAPGLLRTESSNITMKMERTGPTSARISWNIPSPAAGCGADSRAYNGIIVTLDTTPSSSTKLPSHGSVYNSDATADKNLFAGDSLGSSFVVGAFYNDTTSTFVDVDGLQDGVGYYATGFPVDAQYRYFIEGVHAYSLDIRNRGTADTHGSQVVVLNPEQSTMGIDGADSTGLTSTQTYSFDIQVGLIPSPQARVDSTDCGPVTPKYPIHINGGLALTYEDLVAEINHQLSIIPNIPQSATAPNTGTYYWNATTQTLYMWDGSQNVIVSNVIHQDTPPNHIVVGTYWHNTTNDTLHLYNGSSWLPIVVIKSATDPASPSSKSYWFDGATIRVWNGTTWCDTTNTISEIDPTFPANMAYGSFWYNSATETLYRWNEIAGVWAESTAVQSSEDPNTPSLGIYWFNETLNKVYQYVSGWVEQANVAIVENEPQTPAPGKLWYNPSTQDLYQRNITNTGWIQKEVIPFPVDPTNRISCDVWWNTAVGELKVWNSISSSWILVTSLYHQGIDPVLSHTPQVDDTWYNPTTNTLYVWNGYCYVQSEFVYWSADPTTSIIPGTVWYNTSTKVWSERSISHTWVQIDPTESQNDPSMLLTGTMWYNTSTHSLSSWNGIGWVTISYTTASVIPTKGTKWYDTANAVLKEWNGVNWIVGTPIATCVIDCNGNLLFVDSRLGSTSYIQITDGTLFDALTNQFTLHDPKPGVDGASGIPTYEALGIGTDGSTDERRRLQNEIRYELGYPVVDVELTPEQMDYIVDKALSELRSRSSIPYKRGFFFMAIQAETQKYFLTNKISEMDKIVDVLGVYRLTSSFLSSAHGAGVYGQIVLQHMYNMGTFDLLSYHIMADYTKLMELLFAAKITFNWNEQTRQLSIHHRFAMAERLVCIEATTERTEQDLISDRYVRAWLRRYCLATARLILSETRGKFASLPGASGSITLNASELRQAAQTEIEACLQDIEDYVVDKPDEYGMGSQLVFG